MPSVLKPENRTTAQPRLLDEASAAKYLAISISTAVRWRKQRKGPPYFQLAGIIRYPIESLDAFIESHIQPSAQQEERKHER
jgi:predicted DNA-binding transcriptional regulator AlpA